jgi:hypothetical protein
MSNAQDGPNGSNVWWETKPSPREIWPSREAASQGAPTTQVNIQKGYTGLKREITVPSGRKFMWHRPPRHIFWKHGRTQLTFTSDVNAVTREVMQSVTSEEEFQVKMSEKATDYFAGLSDEQRIKTQALLDEVVANSVNLEEGEVPNDLDDSDIWHIYNLAVHGFKAAPVETKDGETDAESVETFSSQSGLSTAGAGVTDVSQPEPSAAHGNS